MNTTLSGIGAACRRVWTLDDERDPSPGDARGRRVRDARSGARRTSATCFLTPPDRAWAREGLSVLPVDEVHAAFRASPNYSSSADAAGAAAAATAKEDEEEEVLGRRRRSGSESSDDESVESATTLSDDDLEAYDLEDDGADLVPSAPEMTERLA